jgi:hypothetical protein
MTALASSRSGVANERDFPIPGAPQGDLTATGN